MTKVTVAMAAYNHEMFVAEAIESVLAQENCDFDFVIVDDGSADNTVKEILKFNDPRIHFIPFKKNQGACTALRKAIEEGKGEYVAILNSDDAFLPGKLQKQVEFLDGNGQISAVFAYPQLIDENGRQPGEKNFCGKVFIQPNRSRQEWLNYFFFNNNALCHPTAMIRRSCYRTLGYYDPRYAQIPDLDFWIRLAFKHEIHIMQEPLIKFRILSNERNASAPSLENSYRFLWELSHVLENYLSISTIEEYLSIFPQEKDCVADRDPQLIPFYLAHLALKNEVAAKAPYLYFATETLYKMLGDEKLKEKVERCCQYRMPDFLKAIKAPIFQYKAPENPILRRLKKLLSRFL